MIEYYAQDYINKITIEYTDKRKKVLEDLYVLNQLCHLLTTMSQADELELNSILEEEWKVINSEIRKYAVDSEESFLFSHSEYENDDILLKNIVNVDSITTKISERN